MLGVGGLKPSAGAYCASKGAVVLLTKQTAVEYGVDARPLSNNLILKQPVWSIARALSMCLLNEELLTPKTLRKFIAMRSAQAITLELS